MKIFIVALRRSGSTVFWRIFRRDRQFLCLDEPFNPLLKELPVEHPKQTRKEFISLYQSDPAKFKARYAPIYPEQEVEDHLGQRHKTYTKWLLGQKENVVLESVRCSFKVPALYEMEPSAFLIHLFRSPVGFVSSHLLPSGGTGRLRNRVAQYLRKRTFWFRGHWYNNYQYEDIIDRAGKKAFSQQMQRVGLNPQLVYSLPAVGKLLALWKTSYERIQADGREYFGDRFLTVSFEDFCGYPEETFRNIYTFLGLEYPGLDFSEVHSARDGFEPENSNWIKLMETLEIRPDTFISSKVKKMRSV